MNSLDTNKEFDELKNNLQEPELNQETGDSVDQPDDISVTKDDAEQPQNEVDTANYTMDKDVSKQELYDKLQDLLIQQDVEQMKEEVEKIKQLFYKKNKVEIAIQRETYIKNGGEELNFLPKTPELETEFKELLAQYRNKKAEFIIRQEKEKENNLLKKRHIIDQMRQLAESNDDVSSNIVTFRQLQQEWKNIGAVPANTVNELWKEYNLNQEKFWDLIKINNELREYDFKKNLEAKTKLIEQAEELATEEDVKTAFHQLQVLHDEWRELGPVARELREDIWSRFKAASTVINKKHQSFFDDVRENEEENLSKKEALCEQIESIDIEKLSSYKEWDDTTKRVLELQEEWRSIGFAPRKVNQKVFDRYRKVCDTFFSAKANFYKESKAFLNQNLEQKKELCQKAEQMKESTDWKETTNKLIALQKEWKTIGAVPKKYSDEVWKRFIAACDYFFEQKNKTVGNKHSTEQENLSKKKEVIEKIKSFQKTDNPSESLTALRTLAAEWNSIGHVPYKEKDKIYKEYRAVLDSQFDALNIDVSQRRLESFKSNLKDMSEKGESKLYRERERLVRAYEHLKSEIITYENNIGFFSVSSKKGNSMLKEMEHKIESLKEECKLLEQKIAMIDEKI
ncbi:MAG: DUF349 domain-containing protein [Paludibacteraceae bacterium]